MLRRAWSARYKLLLLPVAMLLLTGYAMASSTATITVSGSEQQVSGNWDHGTITVAFNSYSETVTYGQFSSAASVASALAGMFSRDYAEEGLSAKAACPPNGTLITFTLQGTAAFGTLGVTGSSSSFQLSSTGFQAASAQTTPVLTWPLPAAINYGTALSGTQLNATANVAGTFSYTPAAGAVLPPGDQVLGVTFTPTNTTEYSDVTETVPLTVNGSYPSGTQTIYSYGLIYDPDGNVDGYNDSVMGAWAFSYDSLNRLAGSVGSQPGNSITNYCWSYDAFGNRWQQMGSNEAISGGGASLCQQQSSANINYAWASYSGDNRMTSSAQAPSGVEYDAAGNVTNDGRNHYLYNADGQICAVMWSYNGITVMTGYIYDADGNRVAKGAISTWGSCDPSKNGFTTQSDYVRDQAGHQLSEFVPGPNGVPAWQHTNVWANGVLIATDDSTETHFYLNDWLGTRRVQTSHSGAVEQSCSSLPYGDGETCSPSPTENLFTGKVRDAESGLDYFGARYYSSSMGRWLSPEYSMNSAIMELPQTWNKYSYEYNRPTYGSDPNGYCPPCVGALIGGVVEGGFDLGKQLYNNGGSLSKVSWGEVGANALGGAVAGGLAVATGGASLVESAVVGDIAAGGTANIVGGIVTRAADPNTSSNDVLSAGAVSQDAVAGFVGGGAGHLAGDVVHVPDDPIRPDPSHQARTSVYNARMAARYRAIVNQGVRVGVASSAATHTTNGVMGAVNSFWNWLMFSPPPSQPTVTTSECDTLPDGSQRCY